MADHAPRVKNPKPDLTYRLLQNAFSADEQYINDEHGARLSLNMHHPFFIVEVKSAEKPIDEAENQCARGGAAMVRLKRKFDSLAEGTYQDNEAQNGEGKDSDHSHNKQRIPVDHCRTDTQSFAFSLAIVPRAATIFVHWAEEAYSKEGQLLTVRWHANYVANYNLKDPAAWVELHRDLDNILDWGVLIRKEEIGSLCDQIYARTDSNKRRKLKHESHNVQSMKK